MNSRYSRHLSLPEFTTESQKLLDNARILVVGCGGLGHPVLQYLTSAGVGTIGVADDDIVQLSNLQRQVLFSEEDIGLQKVIVATKKLRLMNNTIQIEAHCLKIDSSNVQKLLSSYDLVIDCTDNFTVRYLLDETCDRLKLPLVYGSLFRYEGHVSLLHGRTNTGYKELFLAPPPDGSIPDCSAGGVLGALAGTIGSIQAAVAIKYITGIGECLDGELLILDMFSFRMDIISIRKMNHEAAQESTQPETPHSKESNIPEISCALYKEMFRTRNDYQLIDVREPEEFEKENIGGQLIPMNEISERVSEIDKQKPVIVICHAGARSASVVKYLREVHGYKNVFNLKGGLLEWKIQSKEN